MSQTAITPLVETADELEKFFALELGDITSVVAQDIEIEIIIRPGIRAKRTLWRKSTIKGNIVRARINQVYGAQKKDLTLELEIPAGKSLGAYEIGDVKITYKKMGASNKTILRDKVALTLTPLQARGPSQYRQGCDVPRRGAAGHRKKQGRHEAARSRQGQSGAPALSL